MNSAAPRRFIDSDRLTDTDKEAIVTRLVNLKIGDLDSCRLFVRAMEYELDTYREAAALEAEAPPPATEPEPAPQPAPVAERPELLALSQAATALAGLIEALPADALPGLIDNLQAQDNLIRGYDERYLQQMRIEALRLADACAQPVQPTVPVATLPVEPVVAQPATESVAGQKFAASLVHMFEECFERAPTTDPDGDFSNTLQSVSEVTGIPMRTDRAALEWVLMPRMG